MNREQRYWMKREAWYVLGLPTFDDRRGYLNWVEKRRGAEGRTALEQVMRDELPKVKAQRSIDNNKNG